MSGVRIAKWTLLILVAAAVLYAMWKWQDWRAAGAAGSAYAARITCSCRYVEGRSTKSCRDDIAEDARLVSVTEDDAERRITARIPLLGRASAQFRPGYGCLMEP